MWVNQVTGQAVMQRAGFTEACPAVTVGRELRYVGVLWILTLETAP